MADRFVQIRARYEITKVKINEDEFLAAALGVAPNEYTGAKGEEFGADNVFEAMLKH